jgi:hypothetical protein
MILKHNQFPLHSAALNHPNPGLPGQGHETEELWLSDPLCERLYRVTDQLQETAILDYDISTVSGF